MLKSKAKEVKKTSHHRDISPELTETDMANESSLHPEKLTYAKFSEMRRSLDDDKMSIGRLLLYIAIVVIVGVVLTVGVQWFIKYQADQAALRDLASEPVGSEPIGVSYITINNGVKDDSVASPAILANDKFIKTSSTAGKTAVATSQDLWNSFGYDRFTSVERIRVSFDESVEQPKAEVAYTATDKIMYLTVTNVSTNRDLLKPGLEIAKLTGTNTVSSVQNSSTGSDKLKLSIYLNETVTYTVRYADNDLIIDIRQADYVDPDSTATSTTSTTSAAAVTTTTTSAAASVDASKPAAPFYDNSYSKKTQYISSSYTGNKLRIWNYTYRDYGDRYEFKFRIKDDGSNVSPMIPNAKAYLNNDADDPTLVVEISNINWEILNKTGSECFESVAYGNVKKICGVFDASKSMVTYTISLNKLADFEMDTIDNTTVDATRPGQVIWLKIKDN